MGRIIQPKGTKGSLKWVQHVINECPATLDVPINDDTHIPTTRDEWNGALQLMHAILGSHSHELTKYVIDVFIDVQKNI